MHRLTKSKFLQLFYMLFLGLSTIFFSNTTLVSIMFWFDFGLVEGAAMVDMM
jgi:hypothetical protein